MFCTRGFQQFKVGCILKTRLAVVPALNQMLGDTGNVYAPGSGHVVYFRTG
jgi:hypothetical protein